MFILILRKIAPYLKYIIFLGTIGVLLFLWHAENTKLSKLDAEYQLYKRQISGQLTQKEQQFEAANNALGIAQSKMMTQDQLLKSYQDQHIRDSAEFDKFKKQYEVELESYQRTIADLQEQIKGGNTAIGNVSPRPSSDPKPDSQHEQPIDPKTQKLSYSWNSGDGRFMLYDPDIFVSGNETFVLHQNFRVTGEIYKEKTGFLKTQRLTIEEVAVVGKNADGTPKYNVIGTAAVADSQFNYTEVSPQSWVPKKGVFLVEGIITTNFGLYNGISPRFLIGTGIQFLNYKGFGLALQLFIDTTVIRDTGVGLSILYRPSIKTTQLNFGLTLSASTPFSNNIGKDWVPSLGLVFYLW